MAINKIKIGSTEHEIETTVANITDLTATATELNYMDGVTSNVQTQLDGKSPTITGSAASIAGRKLAASRALITNSSQYVSVSTVTADELAYLKGATSNIQTQLDSKAHINGGSSYLKDYDMSENRIYATTYGGPVTDGQDITTLACFVGTAEDETTGLTYDMIIPASADAVLEWINPVGRRYSGSTNGETFNNNSSNKASGSYSHAEGYSTTASGNYSHAEGYSTTASGNYSHTEGYSTTASGSYSHAGGLNTIANSYQYVLGKYNKNTTAPTSSSDTTASAGVFIVGVGTNNSARSNGFRINPAGKPYALSTMSSSGADYAEYFEWMDGNPTDEDRRGRFVTLDGDKIRYATADDDYILGVVSAEPTVVGDIQSEAWHNMYLKDIYGERVVEVVDVEESVDEHGDTIPAHVERRWVLNPDYDPEEEYVSREDRPEWDAVGIVGKLVAVDDGTCQVNGYCYPDIDGVATRSESKTAYRVIERLDDTHIRIFIK